MHTRIHFSKNIMPLAIEHISVFSVWNTETFFTNTVPTQLVSMCQHSQHIYDTMIYKIETYKSLYLCPVRFGNTRIDIITAAI